MSRARQGIRISIFCLFDLVALKQMTDDILKNGEPTLSLFYMNEKFFQSPGQLMGKAANPSDFFYTQQFLGKEQVNNVSSTS